MLAWQLWQTSLQYGVGLQQWFSGVQKTSPERQSVSSPFSHDWEILGPFQIGTREASWGADPLEYYGGFRALEYNESALFKSSLAFNGTVSWTRTRASLVNSDSLSASAGLTVSFPDIDWRSLQDVYGWAALQWQGWARGDIYVQPEEVQTAVLHVQGALEFWIDGVHHFGSDYYSFGQVPLTLHLEPGCHRIDVRLVRDVRVMGGIGEPSVDIDLTLEASDGGLKPVQLREGDPYGKVLHSDLANGDYGPLASPYGSVLLRNDAQEDIFLFEIDASREKCRAELVEETAIKFVPGQTRPVAFRLLCISPVTGRGPVILDLKYKFEGGNSQRIVSLRMWPLTRGLHDPQKITFMHPSGVVSYAILRAPSPNAHCAPKTNAPVMLALHGAGLEAESNLVRHALDPVPDLCAWVLFPTGGSPWSGDDWHRWGFPDVQAAINAIPDWIEQVEWDGVGVDVNRWLVSGHSNGGQGTWYALTHWPDKVFAATPVSGYSSIQNYVPYSLWQVADPGRTAVVQAAMNSYRHELLLENAAGIPILQQHGSRDDNVPPYHSRLLSQLLVQSGANSTYVEMPGKGHWYDDIMTSSPLVEFYRHHLNDKQASSSASGPHDFTVVSANTGDMGSNNGVEITELAIPGQLGKIHISINQTTSQCVIQTSNVQAFYASHTFQNCTSLTIGRQEISNIHDSLSSVTFRIHKGVWEAKDTTHDLVLSSPQQTGGITGILRTKGAFSIISHSSDAIIQKLALQISRNLCQYYGADTFLTTSYNTTLNSPGTRINLVIGRSLSPNAHHPDFTHSIQVFDDRIELNRSNGDPPRIYHAADSIGGGGLAAIFLRPAPTPHERPELVVWGTGEESLEVAARLVPILPGVGQPDFVVADARKMMRMGIEGTLAMGFFEDGGGWEISEGGSFFA